MKKIIAMTLALALIALGMCAFAEERTFIVGFDPDYAPYSYMGDDGNYTGFDVEMAKALCAQLGWKYEEYAVNWDTKDLELNAFACDCIWSGFTINGREDDYAWSYPYVDNSQVILTRKDAGIASIADLAGKVVGVQVATSALELLEDELSDIKDTFADLTQFNSYLTAATELTAGAIDAIAIDVGVAEYYVKNYADLVILDETLATEQYGVGFRVGDTALRDEFNEGLMKLVADGTYSTLAEKYGLADFICLKAE